MNREQIINGLEQAKLTIYKESEINLFVYLKAAWKILEPKTKLLINWHHELISEYLEACAKSQIKRLIINIPPRYTKSNLITICFPTWIWIRSPEKRFIFSSYSQSLSTKHSLDRRALIESQWYQSGWGNLFKMASDQNVKTQFQNDKRGVMYATSMSGGGTGFGADCLIIDDPHNPKGAESDQIRQSVIDSFDRTFSTRLDDKQKGVIIVVMQRLHERDLTGHLLDQKEWEHLKIPAIENIKKTYIYPISNKKKVIMPGEILHEKRENKKEIEAQKKALGSYGFAGQYLQEPSPDSGGIFKRSWFKFYKALPAKFDEQALSADMTFKDSKTSDYVVIQCWGKIGSEKYLLDQVRDRMDFITSLQAFKLMAHKWPNASAKIVEEKANGAALINSLKKQISGIIPYVPKESKESRARAVSPEFEAGNIYFPDPSMAPWVGDVIEELVKFPRAKNDDIVDSVVQMCIRFQQTQSGNFVESMVQSSESIVQDIISEGDSW